MLDKTTCVTLNSGHKMPVVGLGTFLSSTEEIKIALNAAIHAGYRHIDTAYVYWNEESIGLALQEMFSAGKIKREDLFITTKLPQVAHRRVEEFLNRSLKALQLDYIDMYLIHSPLATQFQEGKIVFPFDENGKFLDDKEATLVDTWKQMETCVEKGLAKSIGLSNFNLEQIKRVYDSATIKPANLQVECHAYYPQHELFEFCKKLGIAFTAYSPIGSPGFNASRDGDYPILIQDPKVVEIAKKMGKSPSQVLLRFLVQRGMIVIPKSTNPTRIAENINIFDFQLSSDDMNILGNLDIRHRFFNFPLNASFEDHKEYPFKISF